MESEVLRIEGFGAFFGDHRILKDINLSIPEIKVTAIMGPSGCGKTTLIRCINRMHELVSGAGVEGRILLSGEDVYRINPILVRRKIGMVLQHGPQLFNLTGHRGPGLQGFQHPPLARQFSRHRRHFAGRPRATVNDRHTEGPAAICSQILHVVPRQCTAARMASDANLKGLG